jgi:hypothetical protein
MSAGQPAMSFASSSSGMGMPVGSAMSEKGTQPEIGVGSTPPYMPSVAPPPIGFRSPKAYGVPSSRALCPPAASTKSSAPFVPGETPASSCPSSAWPSVPRMIEAHSASAAVP